MYLYLPIGSMYGIFTYIYHQNQPNVGNYAIHGSYGLLYDTKTYIYIYAAIMVAICIMYIIYLNIHRVYSICIIGL